MGVYIGIDPGLDGAIAYVGENAKLIEVKDTPTMTVQGPRGGKRVYNLAMMAGFLSIYPEVTAYIEKVHAMPGQGVTSMFSMGFGFGAWLGILAALGIPYELVTPQRWKKLMLADQGKDKDASRFKAIQLYPELAHLFARKKDDGRAEAALIAGYGRRSR